MDAVEIDPALARIGRDFHPEDVYTDPRVTVHVNDGRAFLNSTDAKYDLIVYALTDFFTLVSSTPGLRLESFLFTEKSLAQARDHLTEDGVFVMYNLYREPWLVTKLGSMIGGVFGHEPLVRLLGRRKLCSRLGPSSRGPALLRPVPRTLSRRSRVRRWIRRRMTGPSSTSARRPWPRTTSVRSSSFSGSPWSR